jgi:hypothetical protein
MKIDLAEAKGREFYDTSLNFGKDSLEALKRGRARKQLLRCNVLQARPPRRLF